MQSVDCLLLHSVTIVPQVLVTKAGIPITMCTVYAAVARRLGVTLLPVSLPSC